MKKLDTRNDLGSWLNSMGLVGEGAEVGVAYGGFSRIILSQWRGKLLHMIDAWEKQPDSDYKEKTNSDNLFSAWFEDAQKTALELKRCHIHKGYSVDVSKEFSDGFLDFVFIDANHAYEWVLMDIHCWWPKIKRGGVMLGHDYGNDTSPPHYCEVKRAVDHWIATQPGGSVDLHLTTAPPDTFYFFKT